MNKLKTRMRADGWSWFSFDFLIEVSLLAAVFLTPIIFDRRLGIVFSGTKVAWLRAFIITIIGLWAAKLIIERKHPFVRTVLDWPVISFLLSTTVATLTSVHVYVSFTGFYGRFEGLSTWYLYGLLFFITTNYVQSFEKLRRLILAVLPAGVLMSVYSIIQRQELDPYLWGGVVTWQRVIGTIGQPNFIAAYVIMAFFLAMYLYLEDRGKPEKVDWTEALFPLGYFIFGQTAFIFMIYSLDAQDIFLWYGGFALITVLTLLFAFNYEKIKGMLLDAFILVCMILIYVCLLYTQSRGGYMGFFAGAVLFSILAGRENILKNWKKLTVLGILIILVSLFTMLRPEYSPFERFTSEVTTKKAAETVKTENESSLELKGAAGSRGETWKSGFKIIADYPFFGIGPEVLKMVFPRYETELFRFKESFHVKQDRCHNETFDVPVTKGLVTFFIYLWLLFTVFRKGVLDLKNASSSQKLMVAALLSAILSYLIQNQFSFGVVAITSLFWVLWGGVMAVGREQKEAKPVSFSFSGLPWVPLFMVLAAMLFMFYISFLSFRADILFKTGKTYMEMGRLPQAEGELKASIAVFPFEGTTVSHFGITYLNMGKADEAIKALDYGARVDAYNADNFYMLSRVYLSFYDRGSKEAFKEALKNVEIALKIDPYYAEAYETLGQIRQRQGRTAEAAKLYEKAFYSNPTLPLPMQEMVLAYRQLGKGEYAKNVLESAARKFPENLEIYKILQQLK